MSNVDDQGAELLFDLNDAYVSCAIWDHRADRRKCLVDQVGPTGAVFGKLKPGTDKPFGSSPDPGLQNGQGVVARLERAVLKFDDTGRRELIFIDDGEPDTGPEEATCGGVDQRRPQTFGLVGIAVACPRNQARIIVLLAETQAANPRWTDHGMHAAVRAWQHPYAGAKIGHVRLHTGRLGSIGIRNVQLSPDDGHEDVTSAI